MVPWYPQGIGSRTPRDAQVPYIKWPRTMQTAGSAPGDFHLQIENTVLDPQLAESVDAKPRDTEGRPPTYWKESVREWTREVQGSQGSTECAHEAHLKLTCYMPTVSQ